MLFLLVAMLAGMYIFTVLGMAIFGGDIVKSGPNYSRLMSSSYGQSGYWPLNFNDFPSGFVTMFILLHVNNMHVVTRGFVVTNNQWAELFFGAWYAVGVLLMINVLVAFFIKEVQDSLENAKEANPTQTFPTLLKSIYFPFFLTNLTSTTRIKTKSRLAAFISSESECSSSSHVQAQSTSEIGDTHSASSSFSTSRAEDSSTMRPSSMSSPVRLSRGIAPMFAPSIFASAKRRKDLNTIVGDQHLKIIHDHGRPHAQSLSLPQLPVMHALHSSPLPHSPLPGASQGPRSHRSPFEVRAVDDMTVTTRSRAGSGSVPRKGVGDFWTIAGLTVNTGRSRADTYTQEEGKEPESRCQDKDAMIPIHAAISSGDNEDTVEKHLPSAFNHIIVDLSVESEDSPSSASKDMEGASTQKAIMSGSRELGWLSAHANYFFGDASVPLLPYQQAGVFVLYAKLGAEANGFPKNQRELKFFKWRCNWDKVFMVASFVLAFVRFFQRPIWTYRHEHWQDTSLYPRSGLPLYGPETMIFMELPLYLVMVVGLLLELGYKEAGSMSWFYWVLCLHSFLSIVVLPVYAILQNSVVSVYLYYCLTYAQVLYIIYFNYRARLKVIAVSRVLPRFYVVLAVFFGVVMIFSSFGPYLFNLASQDKGLYDDDTVTSPGGADDDYYFRSFGESTWSVFVAITSSSWPGQVIGPYRSVRETAIYFFAFIVLGAYIILNVVVLVVLVRFQRIAERQTDYRESFRKIYLLKAFEALDSYNAKATAPVGDAALTSDQMRLLLNELYSEYAIYGKKSYVPSAAAMQLLVDMLDADGDGAVNIGDFMYVLDILRVKLVVGARKSLLEAVVAKVSTERSRAIGRSEGFLYLQEMVVGVGRPYFKLAVDMTILVLVVATLILDSSDMSTFSLQSNAISLVIVVICVLELVGSELLGGYYHRYKSSRHVVSNTLTYTLVATWLTAAIYYGCSGWQRSAGFFEANNAFSKAIRVLEILRLYGIPRHLQLVYYSKTTARVFSVINSVLPRLYTLIIVLFCLMYIFACISSLAYGGLITLDPASANYEALSHTIYGQSDFYALNFNDFASSCITLFACLHVSDFDVIAGGVAAVSNKGATRVFFTCWYILGPLLCLNILRSLFLADFMRAVVKDSPTEDATFQSIRNSIQGDLSANIEDLTMPASPTTPNTPLTPTTHMVKRDGLGEVSRKLDLEDQATYLEHKVQAPGAGLAAGEVEVDGYFSKVRNEASASVLNKRLVRACMPDRALSNSETLDSDSNSNPDQFNQRELSPSPLPSTPVVHLWTQKPE